jgi:predicted SAM-dependent methyltransferase
MLSGHAQVRFEDEASALRAIQQQTTESIKTHEFLSKLTKMRKVFFINCCPQVMKNKFWLRAVIKKYKRRSQTYLLLSLY